MKLQQMEWRRDRVLELSSQGFSQSDIATVLHVNKSIISKDMAHLRHTAQEKLRRHIDQTIPEEYQKACNTLNQLLRMTWAIVSKTEDEKTRLQALALIDNLNQHRTELVTNGVLVNSSLQIIQSKIQQLNGNGKGKGEGKEKRLLLDITCEDIEAEGKLGPEEEEQLKTTNGVF
jgi:predicted transcriptional regulator